eukprot:894506-Rhodomonas_salina.1
MGVEGRETADREAGAASAEADELAFGRERQLAEHLPPPQHTPISALSCAQVRTARCRARHHMARSVPRITFRADRQAA